MSIEDIQKKYGLTSSGKRESASDIQKKYNLNSDGSRKTTKTISESMTGSEMRDKGIIEPTPKLTVGDLFKPKATGMTGSEMRDRGIIRPLPGSKQPYYGAGNIDLNKRPVIKNEDGSYSTVDSVSFGQDGKEVLIPTVINVDGEWKHVSEDEAWEHYLRTGEYLGKFDSPEQATAYAQRLHEERDEQYGYVEPISPDPTSAREGRIAALEKTADYYKNNPQTAGWVTGALRQTAAGFVNVLPTMADAAQDVVGEGRKWANRRRADEVQPPPLSPIDTGDEEMDAYLKSISGNAEAATERSSMPVATKTGLESWQKKADEIAAKGQAQIEQSKAGATKLEQVLIDIGVGGVQLATDVAMAGITGTNVLPVMAVRSFGNGAQEARHNGASALEQTAYGFASAAVEVLTEKIFGGPQFFQKAYGKGLLDAVTSKLTKKLTSESGKFLWLAVKGFAEEGAEEFIASMLNPVISRIYDDKALQEAYGNSEAFAATLSNALYDGMVGGVLGLAGFGVNISGEMQALQRSLAMAEIDKQVALDDAAQKYGQDVGNMIKLLVESQTYADGTVTRTTGRDLLEELNRLIYNNESAGVRSFFKNNQKLFDRLSHAMKTEAEQVVPPENDFRRNGTLERIATATEGGDAGVTTENGTRVMSETETRVFSALVKNGMNTLDAAKVYETVARIVEGDAALSNNDIIKAGVSKDKRIRAALNELMGATFDTSKNEMSASAAKQQVREIINNIAAKKAAENEATVQQMQQAANQQRAEADVAEMVQAAAEQATAPEIQSGAAKFVSLAQKGTESEIKPQGETVEYADEEVRVAAERAGISEAEAKALLTTYGSYARAAGIDPVSDPEGFVKFSKEMKASGVVKPGEISMEQRLTADILKVALSDLGIKDVVLVTGDPDMLGTNGSFLNGVITINADRVNTQTFSGMAWVVGHEIVHAAEDAAGNLKGENGQTTANAPIVEELFNTMKSLADMGAIVGTYAEITRSDAALNELIKRKQAVQPNLNYYDARAEIAADFFGALLGSNIGHEATGRLSSPYGRADLLSLVGKENGGLLRKAKNFADSMRAKLAAQTPAEAQEAKIKAKMQRHLTKLGNDISKAVEKGAEVRNSEIKKSIVELTKAAGMQATKDANGKVTFTIDGEIVTNVTPEHIRDNSGIGALIKYAETAGNITEDEAKIQFEAASDIMNMIIKTQDPDMVWAWVGSSLFSAVKSNSDGQYGTTIDFTTVCRKTQDMITAMSRAMMSLNRGLTKDEVVDLQREVFNEGGTVPCPVCYVFSRWAGIGSILDNMYRWQQKYKSYTDEQLQRRIDELSEKVDAGKKPLEEMLREQDDTYDALEQENEALKKEKKELETKRKAAVKAKDNVAVSEIDARLNDIEKRLPAIAKQQKEIRDSVAPELSWLENVRTHPEYAEKGEVPPKVLFNLEDAATFASRYSVAWGYRNSRGPSAGKAILPYSDMRLGDFILGVKNTSADGNVLFQDVDGNFTDDQLAAVEKAEARVSAQNLIGGQRFQSTSDFRYDYALDYLMAFWELQAVGSKLQTYTKIIEYADMIAAIRGDVNLSVMPLNKGYVVEPDGTHRLIFSSVTGINYDAAVKSNAMHDNVQLILVGINDEHILAALEDSEATRGNNIGFVIPYHASGASINEFIRVLVANLGETFDVSYYKDYSKAQSDKARDNATPEQLRRKDLREKLLKGKDGAKSWKPKAEDLAFINGESVSIEGRSFEELREIELAALAGDTSAIAEYESWTRGNLRQLYEKLWTDTGSEYYNTRLNSAQAKSVMPHEYWNKNVDRSEAYINGFLFRSYCYNLGLIPRFSGITTKEETYGDFTNSPGYWKTLIDRPMYNNDGTYREQEKVNVSSFKAEMLTPEYAERNWKGYNVKEPDAVRARAAADRFVARTKFSRDDTDIGGYNPGLRYMTWEAQADLVRRNKFGELVSGDWSKSGDAARQSVMYVLDKPTKLLEDIGLSDLPFVITQKHFLDAQKQRWDSKGNVINTKAHQIPEKIIDELPELIKNPVAVFKSDPNGPSRGGIVILTDKVDGHQNPITITVNADQPYYVYDGESGPAHFVNIYGRENSTAYFKAVLDFNSLLYVNKRKANSVPALRAEINRHSSQYGIDFDTVIQQKDPSVNANLPQRKFSRDDGVYAAPMYSKLQREIEAFKGDKIGASSAISYLRGKGVKAEEIKWSGIEQFLEGKKSVSKQELLEFVRGNQLQIEEQELSGGQSVTLEPQYFDADGESNDLYVMRGGELYDSLTWDDFNEVWESDALGYSFASKEKILEYYGGNEEGTRWGQYKLDGGENYREYLFKMPRSEYTNNAMRAHWGDTAGVLAHARVQDFNTADGKILFVEEIQSDWHNEGHKSGYRREGEATKETLMREYTAYMETFHNSELAGVIADKIGEIGYEGAGVSMILNFLVDKSTTQFTLESLERKGVTFTPQETSEIWKAANDAESLYKKWEKAPGPLTPPDAPYSKTYHEFVLKTLLRKAAEGGYTYLAWTPGWMQEERWSSDYAEGYRIEYDQDIPKFLNKYGKQWGAKVEKSLLKGTDESAYSSYGTEELEEMKAEWEEQLDKAITEGALDRFDFISAQIEIYEDELNRRKNPLESNGVWVLHITPAMRDSVLYEGQPKFSRDDSDYMAAVEAGDMDTAQRMVDEAAEAAGYTVKGYHGTTNLFTIFDTSKSNIENDWGRGIYATTSEEDADTNYASEDGPDLTNRIERLAEMMEYWQEYEDMDYEQRKEAARNQLSQGENRMLHIALRMENPVVVERGTNGTFFTYESRYDEETDEYSEPGGTLVDVVETMQSIIYDQYEWASYDADKLNGLFDEAIDYGGMSASELQSAVDDILIDVSDDLGNLAGKEILRAALEELGYDGIVDKTVPYKFGELSGKRYGGMRGVRAGTTHFIAFNSSQAKLTDPVTYDDNGNVIPLSQRFNAENPDIRYSVDDTAKAPTKEAETPSQPELTPEERRKAERIAALEQVFRNARDTYGDDFSRADADLETKAGRERLDRVFRPATKQAKAEQRGADDLRLARERVREAERREAMRKAFNLEKQDIRKEEREKARIDKMAALIVQKETLDEKWQERMDKKVEALKEQAAERLRIHKYKSDFIRAYENLAARMEEKRAKAEGKRKVAEANRAASERAAEVRVNSRKTAKEARSILNKSRNTDRPDYTNDDVEILRQLPESEPSTGKISELAQKLRASAKRAYSIIVNQAQAIDNFSKLQLDGMKAGDLVNMVFSSASTIETIFQNGLVARDGTRIGDAMKEVMLMTNEDGSVDEEKQALLQKYLLLMHNTDRMSFTARALERVEALEDAHPWLVEMGVKEFGYAAALNDSETEATGTEERRAIVREYAALLKALYEAKDKPVVGDVNGKPVSAETSSRMASELAAEHDWLEAKANGIYEWWDAFMREWAVGSTLSADEYATWKQLYPHYVPTYRVDGDGPAAAVQIGGAKAQIMDIFKGATGSIKPVKNIEESFSMLVWKIVDTSRKNELFRNIIDTAMLDAEGVFSDFAIFDWQGFYEAYAENFMGSSEWYLGESYEQAEASFKTAIEEIARGGRITAYNENGERFSAYLSEEMYRSLAAVTEKSKLLGEGVQTLTRIGGKLTNPMKAMITGYNPMFAIRNIMRDIPSAMVNGISGLAFPKYLGRAAVQMKNGSEAWEQFKALGGTHYGYYGESAEWAKRMAEKPGVLNKAKEALGKINEATEAVTRFAEYLATIDKLGNSYEARVRAIKNAAEVTVDFSRKGEYGALANAWIPYFNPAVQGIDKVFRQTFKGDTAKEKFKQAGVTLARASVIAVLPELLQYLLLKAFDRYDDWEEISDRMRDTYFLIPLPGEHKFLKIPKTREWGTILGTPLMRILEGVEGRSDPFNNYVEDALLANFTVNGVEEIVGIGTLLNIRENKDFAGRDIVPYAYQDASPSMQYDSDTTAIAFGAAYAYNKTIAKLAESLGMEIELSPMQLDYILNDYCGDFVYMLAEMAPIGLFDGSMSLGDVFGSILSSLEGSWVGDNRYSNFYVSEYYDALEYLERGIADEKLMNPEDYKNSYIFKLDKAFAEAYGDKMSELNKAAAALKDGEEKDAIKEQIAELAIEASAWFRNELINNSDDPFLRVSYGSFSNELQDALIGLEPYSSDYHFKPSPSTTKNYTDPYNSGKEYVLTDEQYAKYKEFYSEAYNDVMTKAVKSSAYKRAKGEEKAKYLDEARDDVHTIAKEELFKWLRQQGVKSTPKKD